MILKFKIELILSIEIFVFISKIDMLNFIKLRALLLH